MNVLSLFSGIGGIDLGLQNAGMTIAGQVEIEPWCRSVLARHWPEVPRHDDVRTAAQWWLEGWHNGSPGPPRPSADLVAGGFPCQPVSQAGKRLGQADSRWLWPAFADVIRHLRPRYALVENVPGLLGRGMGDILADLAALGYDAEWDCVPACFVAAPHIRNRIWIVAYPADDWAGWRQQQPQGCQGARHVADGDRGRCESVRITQSARQQRAPGYEPDRRSPDVADAIGNRLERPESRLAATYPRGRRPISQSETTPNVANASRLRCGHRPRIFIRERAAQRGRWPAEPDVGRVAHGIPHRVDRLRGLGNAVVPQVAEHIGRLILAADQAGVA